MKRQRWTDEAVALLRELYPTTPGKEIAARIGCSIDRIYHKASTLGLRKGAEFYAQHLAGRLDGVRGANTRFQAGHKTWNAEVWGRRSAASSGPTRPPGSTAEIGDKT